MLDWTHSSENMALEIEEEDILKLPGVNAYDDIIAPEDLEVLMGLIGAIRMRNHQTRSQWLWRQVRVKIELRLPALYGIMGSPRH